MTQDDWQEQIYELMERSDSAQGAEKVALLDEAVRLAELRQDVERATYIREQLFEAAFEDGQFERALAEFNIMIAAADRNMETFGGEIMPRLLWLYKWVADDVASYPSLTRQQVETFFAEMERRYREAGLSLRAVHGLRAFAAIEMGDVQRANDDLRRWQEADEDGSEDCAACELNNLVRFHLKSNEEEKAIERAAPLLTGKMRCADVPGITHASLLVPMLRLGRLADAAGGHRRSFRQMRETRKFLAYLAEHLKYLALTDDATRGVKLLESRLAWALETRNGENQFHFFAAARLLLARLARADRAGGQGQTIRLLLPEKFEHTREDGTYVAADLAETFLAMARDVAERFDRRNGNDRYARLLQANEDLIDFEPIADLST